MKNKDKQLHKENLERLIAHELMLYTQKTGDVVEDLYINPHKDKSCGQVYYDIDIELL